jgi:nicotinate phosphoribosyltransferase
MVPCRWPPGKNEGDKIEGYTVSEDASVPNNVMRPSEGDVASLTDAYFTKSKAVVGKFGDVEATYAVFMRRPVIFCPRIAVDWLGQIAEARGVEFGITLNYDEGDWVGAGEPLMYITGSLYHLVDLETLYLQKIGPACVAAHNAYEMCIALPETRFIAMDARHCAGTDMADLMAYGASVGSNMAKKNAGAVGFVGNATHATSHYFHNTAGIGTMPHALIGYAGSTLEAAKIFHETHPNDNLTVLVDYFGREISDSLEVAKHFASHAAEGRLAFRLDTHSGRFVEGLDTQSSYEIMDRNSPKAIQQFRTEAELKNIVGTGVSAAAIWHLREQLNSHGFPRAKIVGSSGFNVEKCRAMSLANAPVDTIGTGSFLPNQWVETYATADIIEYGGNSSVKVGREFLLRKRAGKT